MADDVKNQLKTYHVTRKVHTLTSFSKENNGSFSSVKQISPILSRSVFCFHCDDNGSEMGVGEVIEGIQSEIHKNETDFQSLKMGSFEGKSSQDVSHATGDLYNLQDSVAVTEVETEKVSAESSDALNEIDGKMSFPYDQCNKVCMSMKRGLTRHKNYKHCDIEDSDETGDALCEETFTSSVESI